MSDATATKTSLQDYLANMTQKQAEQLDAAIKRIPADKREWSPMKDARSAMDQYAECAILTGSTAELIRTRNFGDPSKMNEFFENKKKLATDYAAGKKLLDENVPKAMDAIRSVKDEDLDVKIDMPWGPMTLRDIIGYPFWNMSYHEGQINYIASMLGTLE